MELSEKAIKHDQKEKIKREISLKIAEWQNCLEIIKGFNEILNVNQKLYNVAEAFKSGHFDIELKKVI